MPKVPRIDRINTVNAIRGCKQKVHLKEENQILYSTTIYFTENISYGTCLLSLPHNMYPLHYNCISLHFQRTVRLQKH